MSRPRSFHDAVIRLRAVNAVLDDSLSRSGSVREDPRDLSLRADLDVAAALLEYQRDLSSLNVDVQVAREAVAEEARKVAFWRSRIEMTDDDFLAKQAESRHRSHELRTSELRLELEEWEQIVADYSTVIDMLKARLPD